MRLSLTSLALAIALSGCSPSPSSLLASPAHAAAADKTDTSAPFPYAEADISELQAQMAAGELDSVTLTRAYLDRIARLDRAGPRLNSVLELNPDALKEAAALDAERRRGQLRGPLHGIPLLLKDNIGARPMGTSAGSLALAGFRPDDAFLVTRLRAAGALILGKTNLSEWANFRSSQSVSGWSARGGQTRNPYRLSHSPCGSSSGSAVAVAANLVAAAVGTETDGSIVCPAAVNGIVGLKPTVGLVSRDGVVPISFSQDTPGPMTRSVSDAAALLTAMAGRDDADPATATRPGQAVYDYTARLKDGGLRGARIGVLYGSLDTQPGVAPALQHAVAVLRDAGAVVVPVRLPTQDQWEAAERIVLLHEFKAGMARYLSTQQAPVRDLDAIIAFNRTHADKELVLFGQDLMESAAQAGALGSPEYIAARTEARRLAGPEGIDAALKAERLDALVAPTTGAAWPLRSGEADAFPGGNYSAAAVAGYPSISVPMAHVNGLPLGLLFMGTAWSEPRLIELAYDYEQRTRARKPPAFKTEALIR
ncbi:amidase [Stenotrophomonas oahuensis]|uniref:Amidase n=1 Tax=Stenotrophomonas oahuensis TaxID=3003271 RepID=A0ABY9YKP1_9GAMM|nr:amidase [Stenotrophomonas sp. A5586]WNH51035.1 amidase [Stenotrophomonas sp. A5586]